MDHLAAEKHERGRAVIVAVDGAHLLSADQLEELRLLTNSEMDRVAPFAGLLLGQPTLRRRIKLGAFAALDQRIALRYALPGMTEPETRQSYSILLSGWPHSSTRTATSRCAMGSPSSCSTRRNQASMSCWEALGSSRRCASLSAVWGEPMAAQRRDRGAR